MKDRPDVGLLPQSLQLQQATIAYETAQAQYRVATKNATAAQVAQAQSAIAQAQAGLDRLRKAPSAEQIEIAQASVDQAQITLEQAQNRLADTSHRRALGRNHHDSERGGRHLGAARRPRLPDRRRQPVPPQRAGG